MDLERDYNLRLTFGDEREYNYKKFSEQSSACVDSHVASIDTLYGRAALEKMDIFPAEHCDTCFVFIHGGYWRGLDKKIFNFLAKGFVNNNISFVNVNYGLAPEYRIDQMISQIGEAVTRARQELESSGTSIKNIYLCGHSAGGHLGVMSAIRLSETKCEVADYIKGVIPVSALFDLTPLRNISVNNILNLTNEEVVDLSPTNWIKNICFPMLVAVGEHETTGFLHQTNSFFQRCREQSKLIDISIVPETNHFSVLGAMTEDSQSFFKEIISFIAKYNSGKASNE